MVSAAETRELAVGPLSSPVISRRVILETPPVNGLLLLALSIAPFGSFYLFLTVVRGYGILWVGGTNA
jgi:hypothetical protein